MVKSDDDAKEFSIFDLDNAPPPPPPGRRGVSRTLSPLQARRDAKNFSPIISGGKSTKEKVGRGRIWSTESIPGIKSIWSTEDTEKLPPPPPSRRSSATEGRPNTPIEWNSDRRLSLNIDSSRGPSRSFKPIVSHDNRRPSLKDMIRSLSPQPPPPPPPRIEDLSDNEGEASIRDLENAPSDNSLSFLHDGSSQPWMHRSGVLPDSTSSVQSDDRLTRMGNSSQTRKVSFGPNALPKTGSSRQGTLSSQLEAPDSDDGEATDYGYGDMEDGIGLSSSRSSGGVQSTIIRQRSESQNSTGNWSHNWSDHNPTECDPEDEAEHFESMTSQTMNARPPVVIAGISLPKWVPRLPTVNDISIKIVTYCFCSCLCGGVQQMTDRAILGRLNVLIGLLSIFPLGASTFLAVVLYAPFVNLDRDLPPQTTPFTHSHTVSESLWTLNGPMLLVGIFSFVSFSAAVFTWRVVRDVDLIGAIRYLWVLVWCLPFFIFAGISLFDRFNTTQVWVQNFWRSPQMAWIRRRNCHPSSVYNTLCTVPDVQNETQWCIDNYNSTECTSIRTSAEQSAVQSLVRYYAFTGVWVLCLFCIVLLAIRSLENIISKPLVQKSRESNVPGWLSLPCMGCLALGGFFTFSHQSSLSALTKNKETIGWILGPMYLAAGGCFFAASALGWYISNVSILSTMDKRRKLGAVYLFTGGLCVLVLLLFAICGMSIRYSVYLEDNPVTDDIRGEFACHANYIGECTRCDDLSNRCPEWTVDEVTSILQTQAKSSATVASIFVCYCFTTIRFGFVMMQRISSYQIAYV